MIQMLLIHLQQKCVGTKVVGKEPNFVALSISAQRNPVAEMCGIAQTIGHIHSIECYGVS